MDKNIILVGAAAIGLLLLSGKMKSGVVYSEMPQATSGGSSPVNTAENFEQPPLLNLGNKQAIEAARQSVSIIDTQTTFEGSEVLQDLSLAGKPLLLQSGIVTLGPHASSNVMGCGAYKDTGLIWDFSTGSCHDAAWYVTHQPGLAKTWGLL